MEIDQTTKVHPFVFIQYPSPPSRPVQFASMQTSTSNVNRPPTENNDHNDPPPTRRKRQQNGYACDKCRERRVRCDRGKPTCGQCSEKYKCAYSNESLRLDHVSMRQRMEEMQSTIKRMNDVLMRLETDYRDTITNIVDNHTQQQQQQLRIQMNDQYNPMFISLQQQQQQHSLPISPPNVILDPMNTFNNNHNNHTHNNNDNINHNYNNDNNNENNHKNHIHHLNNHSNSNINDPDSSPSSSSSESSETQSQLLIYDQKNDPSIIDWATKTGWRVTSNDGITSIYTNITSYEDLREAVRRALQMTYQFSGTPLYMSPTTTNTISINNIPSFSVFERLGRIQAITIKPSSSYISSSSSSTHSTSYHDQQDTTSTTTDKLLETDVMTRLIQQHHRCGFPILVSPSRFEQHYQKGELKSVVLSSIFCHIAPHACIYHPHLVHLQDYRALGERFYNHSRDELGLNESPSLSSIHQHTLLIMYDLDLGRVRRAFLHLGVAISMCYSLNLHRPEGYIHCKTAFEREQAKRVFWTIWFYDSMVPHFFAQPSTIRQEDIKIELPCVLSDFDPIETDQTRFAISFIQVRRLRNSERGLKLFYKSLPESARYQCLGSPSVDAGSFWARRTYYCVLLDYCLHWIKLYTPRLPNPLAIRRTTQAAFAMLSLFSFWFRPNEQFDCFFRPYLYHYMTIISVFKGNILQKDGPRSPTIVAQSKAALVKLFHMYRMTPTYRSFSESQLEKDLLIFMQNNQILTMAQLQYGHHQEPDLSSMVELLDDPEADFGWGIFSTIKDQDMHHHHHHHSMNSSTSSSCSSLDNDNYSTSPSKNMNMDYF